MFKSTIKNLCVILVSLFLIFGCGLVDDVQELLAENNEFQRDLQEEHGFKPTVSAKLNNGRLFVLVTLRVDEVGNRTIKEIYETIHADARAAFTETIHKLTISIID